MLFKVIDFFVRSWSFLGSDLALLLFHRALRDPEYKLGYYILKLSFAALDLRSLLMFSRRLETPREQRILGGRRVTWRFEVYWTWASSEEWVFLVLCPSVLYLVDF